MDIIPPQLGCLKIYGKLTLLPNLNATIAVTCIEVSRIESGRSEESVTAYLFEELNLWQ